VSETAKPLEFRPPEVPEDQARAGYYALLARLYYAGPDAALLATIAGSDESVAGDERSPLSSAWRSLAAAAAAVDAEAARLEHEQLFIGTGKAEVTPYATFYLVETGREKILVRLRGDLARLGLARSSASHEPEDHVAALFDVMRHLVSTASGDDATQQKEFFERYIEGAYRRFCTATSVSKNSNFYKHVAHFAQIFLTVESEALKMF
jgi:TorA maturation chaperone TorD